MSDPLDPTPPKRRPITYMVMKDRIEIQRQNAQGIGFTTVFFDDDFASKFAEPTATGQVTAHKVGDAWETSISIRRDYSEDDLYSFAEWAERNVRQLQESGDPRNNGWYPERDQDGREKDAHWFMVAVRHNMPRDPFLSTD